MNVNYVEEVSSGRMSLEQVPEEKRVTEVCFAAVNRDGRAIIEVLKLSRVYITLDMINTAVSLCPDVIKDMNCDAFRPWIGQTAAMNAVKKDGMLLEYVPEYLRMREICEAAVAQNPKAAQFVPPNVN